MIRITMIRGLCSGLAHHVIIVGMQEVAQRNACMLFPADVIEVYLPAIIERMQIPALPIACASFIGRGVGSVPQRRKER